MTLGHCQLRRLTPSGSRAGVFRGCGCESCAGQALPTDILSGELAQDVWALREVPPGRLCSFSREILRPSIVGRGFQYAFTVPGMSFVACLFLAVCFACAENTLDS